MKALLYRNIVILVYVLLLPLVGFAQRAGDLDRSFNFGRGENYGFNYANSPNRLITNIVVQPDGKILTCGVSLNLNNDYISNIARLNTDGSLDTSFITGIGANSRINSIALQVDGKILIAGWFGSYNGITIRSIARLNIDGSLDSSFNPGFGAYAYFYSAYSIKTIALQADGKIIIGGDFTGYNGRDIRRIARLNSDGSIDPSFNPGTGTHRVVNNVLIQADGKIIIEGEFENYNGTLRNGIARLNADGSLDASFVFESLRTRDGNRKIALQADGKIVISGSFTPQGNAHYGVFRLNSNGSLDASFNLGTGFDMNIPNHNPFINTIALQADGKITFGGGFNSYNGTIRNCVGRLNANGTLDTSFTTGTGPNSYVNAIALKADGKTVIGGGFTFYNGTPINRISCLNSDGSLDINFNPATGASNTIYSTIMQSDGKIIIGGEFASYNDMARNRIARLNADGSLDVTFNPSTGANSTVLTNAIQANSKIIIGGDFTSYNGTIRNRIARLNADGSLDVTFNPGTGANSTVLTNAIQADGKIIIGGWFTSFNGIARIRIARLNIDGSLDTSFNPRIGANSGGIEKIVLQPNGKIIVGGDFTSFNGTSRSRIARLNTDGSLDTTFNPGTAASSTVYTIALQADGKIIIGGRFTSFNGTSRYSRLARLNVNGSIDTTFQNGLWGANNVVTTCALQFNGKIIIGGNYIEYNGTTRYRIARLNSDGSLDTTFNPEGGPNNSVHSLVLQPNGKIIIGGNFTEFNGLSTPSIARIHGGNCPGPTSIIVTGNRNLCDGDPTTLTSSLLTGNLWNTGDTTRSITVNQAGIYTVRSMNNGCTSAVSNPITVSVIAPPSPQIAFDSMGNRCLGSEIIVSVAGNHNQFRWNTGATTRSINVRRSGEYSAEVLDSSGCWSLPSRPARIVFDTAFCIIRISIIGLDSLEASIYADRYEWFLDGIQLLAGNNDKVIPIQGNGVYTVRAIIDGRTSPMSEPIVITSGKKSINAPKLKLYPNPTTGIVTLTTSSDAEIIAITNAVGQLVHTTIARPEMELNLNHLAKGVYMVQVQSNKGVSTQRLVIQ